MLFKWLRGLRDAAMPDVDEAKRIGAQSTNHSLTLTRLTSFSVSLGGRMATTYAPALALTEQAHPASARLPEGRLNYSPNRCTCTALQRPPRAVGMPLSFSPSAIWRSDDAP